MPVEIEKKYRLSDERREQIFVKLSEVGSQFEGEDFEENTLYTGGILNLKPSVLRLRQIENRAILTYKERLPSDAGIKRQIEHETEIENAAAMREILQSLGYKPALIYEKRRRTWLFEQAEIVVDELPFGWFMEIEASETVILAIEKQLGIEDLTAEMQTYPALTAKHGTANGEIIEARFLTEI
jgi:adenylate cyclase class 2